MTVHVGSVGPPIRANTMEPEVYRQLIGIQGDMSFTSGPPQGIIGRGDFAVTQNGTPNMSVNVGAGFACIAGTLNVPVQGAYSAYNDGTVNVAVTTANATNPRIDVVCLTVKDAYYSGASNTALLQVIAGVAASSPNVPAIPDNSIDLAHIYVQAGIGSITNAWINTTSGANNPDTVAFVPKVMPPGLLAVSRNVATSPTATSTTYPGIVLATLGANINPGRNIRVTVSGRGNASVNTGLAMVFRRDSTDIGFGYTTTVAQSVTCSAIDQGATAGVHAYTVYIFGNSGTGGGFLGGNNSLGGGTILDEWALYVEDVGPTS